MDPERFDLLTRRLGLSGSRRQTLAAVVGAALTPLNAAAKPERAACLANGKRCARRDIEPDRRGQGKRKKRGKHRHPSCAKCCSRHGAAGPNSKPRCACKPVGASCDGSSQCCGGLCRAGSCTKCPGDLTVCNGNCVDLPTDPKHCGDCANACGDGQRCVAGACACDARSCPNGCCDSNTACRRGTDQQACGVGGAACETCGSCTACDGSICAPTDGACCNDGFGVCQGATCVACDQGQRCRDGRCVCDATSCPDGCCDGDACRGGDNAACGDGGELCRTCGTCLACDGTTCVDAVDACCGEAAACRAGQCVACDPRQRCQRGQCVCDSVSCADGCCRSGSCLDGASHDACGQNGGVCRACQADQTCFEQACCTPKCAGKCGGASDGCGGSCNDACPNGTFCDAGQCVDCRGNGLTCPDPPIGSKGCCGGGCRQFAVGGDFFCCTVTGRECGTDEECCSGGCEFHGGDFTKKTCG